MLQERKRLLLAQIASTPIPPSLTLPPRPRPSTPQPLFPVSTSSTSARDAATHETIQQLIAGYLAHHGYADTAAAFATQRQEEYVESWQGLFAGSTEVDSAPAVEVKKGDDAGARGVIRGMLLRGDAAGALEKVERLFPAVLKDDGENAAGGMRFKLRLRVFIEAIHAVAVAHDHKDGDEAAMDLSDAGTSEGAAGAEDRILLAGQELHAAYGADPRPAVQAALRLAFSLVAYEDPRTVAGEVGWLLSSAARETLASELNGAILGESLRCMLL